MKSKFGNWGKLRDLVIQKRDRVESFFSRDGKFIAECRLLSWRLWYHRHQSQSQKSIAHSGKLSPEVSKY
ncbi:hypothetical protein [Microcoleus sp. herbarium12]|uniref:hypothetical protein n=1 Tax=Microcoleus sp. herbarium12 TaxID=3055437 RepID=UPI002FD07DF9